MSYYVFFHFKSDIVPHPIPLLSTSPHPTLSLFSFQSWTYFYLLPPFCLSPPYWSKFHGILTFLISIPLSCHLHGIFHSCDALFSFCISSSVSPPFLLCTPTHRFCQSLCVLGRCCGCRQPALCRRPSTRQGRGVRIHCSQGIDSMLCRGPPIAQTCSMNMLLGRTSDRAEPPPATSESSSHSLGWSNIICTWFMIYWHWMLRCEAIIFLLWACKNLSPRADPFFFLLSYVWFYITGCPTELMALGLWCTMAQCFTTKNVREI